MSLCVRTSSPWVEDPYLASCALRRLKQKTFRDCLRIGKSNYLVKMFIAPDHFPTNIAREGTTLWTSHLVATGFFHEILNLLAWDQPTAKIRATLTLATFGTISHKRFGCKTKIRLESGVIWHNILIASSTACLTSKTLSSSISIRESQWPFRPKKLG